MSGSRTARSYTPINIPEWSASASSWTVPVREPVWGLVVQNESIIIIRRKKEKGVGKYVFHFFHINHFFWRR